MNTNVDVMKKALLASMVVFIMTACAQPPQPTQTVPQGVDKDYRAETEIFQAMQAAPAAAGASVSPLPEPTRENVEPPVFSLDMVDPTQPRDVLIEISWVGGSGPGDMDNCGEQGSPQVVSGQSVSFQWLYPISILTCGWQQDERIQVTVEAPDGKRTTETISAQPPFSPFSPSGPSEAYYQYVPDDTMPPGTYKISFAGPSGSVDVVVEVIKGVDPQMVALRDGSQLLLYNFRPNETVRIVAYRYGYFVGSSGYQVDLDGQLSVVVAPSVDSASSDPETAAKVCLVAIGDESGEASTNQDGCQDTNKAHYDCPGAPAPQLQPWWVVRVVAPYGIPVADLSSSVPVEVAHLQKGDQITILESASPTCISGTSWWPVDYHVQDHWELFIPENHEDAALVEYVVDEREIVNAAWDLREQLPIRDAAFTLDYDYSRDMFVVELQTPRDESKLIFERWIRDHGYGVIPSEEFVFTP